MADRCSVSQQLGALQTHTTHTFLFISHTTNVLLFKFRCNIFNAGFGSEWDTLYTRCLLICNIVKRFYFNFSTSNTVYRGAGRVVGIATAYGLDGPGIESQCGARFSAPVQAGPEAHPASCTMGTGSFLGVRCGRGVTLTSHPF